jgi:hypothetical protein
MNSSNDAVLVGGTIAIDHVKTPDAEGTELLGGWRRAFTRRR